jgi:hypothetical protein
MALSEDVLDLEIHGDFEGTLRNFFKELSLQVWVEGEGFSGKRPFGNSGWKFDVYAALIEAKIVPGKLDEYGHVEECDIQEIDRLITELIVEHA